MVLTFKEDGHLYSSDPPIDWISATGIISKLHEKFDPISMSIRNSQDPRNKWYGYEPEFIRNIWQRENDRSTESGTYFHSEMERRALLKKVINHRGIDIPIIQPIVRNGLKIAPEQVLKDGCYPEHFVYDEEYGVCGQSDIVYSADGYLDVEDYKTNKKIDTRGYGWNRGRPKMMYYPVGRLEDCHLSHYQLQLSIYMNIILKKNPGLKPGNIKIYHVLFEMEGEDEYGFPIHKRTEDGGFIVKSIKSYKMPYLKAETDAIFEDIKNNPNKYRNRCN